MAKLSRLYLSAFFKEWKWTFLVGLVICGIYFTLRLINLSIIPVFADEAIYIRWSQVMRAEPTLRFLPLSDGKQPLFMWLMIPFLKFVHDPLLAGRLVSAFSGFGTLMGIFLLSFAIFRSKRISLVACLLYAVVPFAVFFDRMALADSLLSMFGVWILFLSVLLVKSQRLDVAMILGMVLGGGLLTKSPAIFFAVLLPASLLLFPFKKSESRMWGISKLIGLWLVVYLLALAIYNILRLGPNFQMIALRNSDYVFPVSRLLTSPFDPLLPHLTDLWNWFFTLTTFPILLASLLGIGLGLVYKRRETLLLGSWFFIPLVAQAELAKVFTARYVYYSLPVFLLFATFSICMIFNMIKPKKLIYLFIPLFLLLALRFDYLLLTSPEIAPLPRVERSGYFEEWTAGQGIREASEYLRSRAKEKNVFVGTEGYFGTLPDGLQIYLEGEKRITIVGVGVSLDEVPQPLINSRKDNEVYLLINDDRLRFIPEENGFQTIATYPKAERPNKTHEQLLLLMLK